MIDFKNLSNFKRILFCSEFQKEIIWNVIYYSYVEHVKKTSTLFRDQPLLPFETAKYWVEYVAKYEGALHLKSVAVELPFYAFYNLDVWAFILIAVILIVFTILKVLQFIASFVFGASINKKLKSV